MSWRTIAFIAALFGCSVPNKDHCALQDGDATCKQRDPSRPYCSKCVGENDGCVIEPVADEICAAVTGGPESTTTLSSSSDPSDGTVAPTGGMSGTSTGTTEGITTGMSMSGTGTTTTTSDPGTTGTGSTGTGSTGPATTDTSTTEPDTSTSTSTSSDTTGPDTTSTTTSTTGMSSDTEQGGKCGNGFIEGQENCDGINFGGKTCKSESVDYGGGVLTCTDTCLLDYSKCCKKLGVKCSTNAECCSGLTCKLDGLLEKKCG